MLKAAFRVPSGPNDTAAHASGRHRVTAKDVLKPLVASLGAVLACAVLVIDPTPAAADDSRRRPLRDFLSQQGTHCLPSDPPGTCVLFQPPVPNFVGWSAPQTFRFALVDYAGVFNNYYKTNGGNRRGIGTEIEGSVTERRLPDGRALVDVRLETEKALFWVSDFTGNNFSCEPTNVLFGNCYQDVLAGTKRPTTGESRLDLRFTNTGRGAPLPDFVQLLFQPAAGQEIRAISFRAEARGPLRSKFGVPDGTPGKATITQICREPCAPNFLFQQESIDLVRDRRRD
jgi:hypothetical protein